MLTLLLLPHSIAAVSRLLSNVFARPLATHISSYLAIGGTCYLVVTGLSLVCFPMFLPLRRNDGLPVVRSLTVAEREAALADVRIP